MSIYGIIGTEEEAKKIILNEMLFGDEVYDPNSSKIPFVKNSFTRKMLDALMMYVFHSATFVRVYQNDVWNEHIDCSSLSRDGFVTFYSDYISPENLGRSNKKIVRSFFDNCMDVLGIANIVSSIDLSSSERWTVAQAITQA